MPYTIKQIADELGVSKTAIRKRIKKELLQTTASFVVSPLFTITIPTFFYKIVKLYLSYYFL